MTIDKSRGNYPAVEYMLLCMGKRRAVGITAKPDNFPSVTANAPFSITL
jgi:hypothetical protein